EQVRLLGGQEARSEDRHGAVGALCAQRREQRVDRLAPADRRELAAVAAQPGRREARQLAIALVRRAAVVAHPVVVDFEVEARLVAADGAAPVLERDVAPDVAAGTDRRLLVEVPYPLDEAEAGRGQRADRADVDDAGRQRVVELATRESADLRVRAALEEAELAGLRDLLREPDAAGALDAPVHVEDHG